MRKTHVTAVTILLTLRHESMYNCQQAHGWNHTFVRLASFLFCYLFTFVCFLFYAYVCSACVCVYTMCTMNTQCQCLCTPEEGIWNWGCHTGNAGNPVLHESTESSQPWAISPEPDLGDLRPEFLSSCPVWSHLLSFFFLLSPSSLCIFCCLSFPYRILIYISGRLQHPPGVWDYVWNYRHVPPLTTSYVSSPLLPNHLLAILYTIFPLYQLDIKISVSEKHLQLWMLLSFWIL